MMELLLLHEVCNFCCHEVGSLFDEVLVTAFRGAVGFQGIVRNEIRLDSVTKLVFTQAWAVLENPFSGTRPGPFLRKRDLTLW